MFEARLTRYLDSRLDRFGLLLTLIIASFVIAGIDGTASTRAVAGLLNLLVISVGFASTRIHGNYWTLLGFIVIGVASAVLVSKSSVDSAGTAIGSIGEAFVLGALTLAILGRVASHKHVTNATILGVIAAYMLIGQFFGWVYLALPGLVGTPAFEPALSGDVPFYYSYVVLTTLGFGDIHPVGALSERITTLEAIAGQMFLAILVARLVAVYSRPEGTDQAD